MSIPSTPASTTCCRNVDYLIASSNFPRAGPGNPIPSARSKDSERIRHARRRHDVGRARGPGARGGGFVYSPGFVVNCVDTTGAGDVFHGAFCYAVFESMPIREALEFSNAMAALNCTALGRAATSRARGGAALLRRAQRCSNPAFEQPVLNDPSPITPSRTTRVPRSLGYHRRQRGSVPVPAHMPAVCRTAFIALTALAPAALFFHPHFDVHSRRMAAHRRQHVVPVDFRPQRGRSSGSREVSFSVFCLWNGGRSDLS